MAKKKRKRAKVKKSAAVPPPPSTQDCVGDTRSLFSLATIDNLRELVTCGMEWDEIEARLRGIAEVIRRDQAGLAKRRAIKRKIADLDDEEYFE